MRISKNRVEINSDLINKEPEFTKSPFEVEPQVNPILETIDAHPFQFALGIGVILVLIFGSFFFINEYMKWKSDGENAQNNGNTTNKPSVVLITKTQSDTGNAFVTTVPGGSDSEMIDDTPIATPTPTLPLQEIVFDKGGFQIPTITPTITPTPTVKATVTPRPTITPLPTLLPTAVPADKEPPIVGIFYPQANSEITYKIDGKICAIADAPSDNISNWRDITIFFAFDSDPFSSVKGSAYLCKDSLPNGPHTLRHKSQDKAGNMEAERTLNFTVNIPGN